VAFEIYGKYIMVSILFSLLLKKALSNAALGTKEDNIFEEVNPTEV